VNIKGELRDIIVMRTGGQRSQRRKWSHMIYSCDEIFGFLFLVALPEYNLCLEEDDSTSRMHESLLLFEQVLSYPKLQTAKIGLVFTQVDLFREKIEVEGHDLSACFPEYDDGCEFQQSLEFIQDKFISLVPDKMLPKLRVMTVCAFAPDSLQALHRFLQGEDIPSDDSRSRKRR
jgi:guanine nucleotide-binding protein G(i) subunit alpha